MLLFPHKGGPHGVEVQNKQVNKILLILYDAYASRSDTHTYQLYTFPVFGLDGGWGGGGRQIQVY